MKEHGIFTSESEFWLHFHPLDCAAYLYRVADCRDYILTNRLPVIDASSKDGTVTGRGYLVPKSASIVRTKRIDTERIGAGWVTMTDREAGNLGAHLLEIWLRQGLLPELGTEVVVLRSLANQYSGVDLRVGGYRVELKTERVRSNNLFVQCAEGGHRATLTSDGATTRHTEMPASAPDPGFVGYDAEGRFVHYCHCGRWAAFGHGVALLRGQLGRWYCAEHRPGATINRGGLLPTMGVRADGKDDGEPVD